MGAETTTVVPPSPGKLPGITVSDAFGLPNDWTLASSLKGEAARGGKLDVEPEKPADAPDPDAMEQQKAAEKAAAEKKTADDAVTADKAEADRVAAEKKEKTEAALAAKTAAAAAKAKPAEKPAAGAGAAKPAIAAKPAATATPAAPAKIKIGDKEYTEEELKKRLEPETPPVVPAKPTPEAKKEPTAEEKAAEVAKVDKIETEWIAGAAQGLRPSSVDEATMEKILTGGKEAVEAFDRIRREDMARTVLAVRKDLDQLYKPFFDAVQQMQQGNMTAADERMETEFVGAHPELEPYMNVVRQHAQALVETDPESVAKMSEKDFNAKVAELTIGYIRQFNPKFGEPAEGAPAVSAAVPAAGAAAVTAAARTLAAAKPAARVTPKPPAGTLPAGAPSPGGGQGSGRDFQKSAVASLM